MTIGLFFLVTGIGGLVWIGTHHRDDVRTQHHRVSLQWINDPKTKLIIGRLQRKVSDKQEQLSAVTRPLTRKVASGFWALYHRVTAWEKVSRLPRQQRERRDGRFDRDSAGDSFATSSPSTVSITTLLEKAEAELSAGQLEHAEECYIDILRRDPRSREAYWGLTTVYQQQKSYDEALETLAVLAKLDPNESRVWHERAEIAMASGDAPEALAAMNRAVSVEPHNPKYLDYLCEIAIINGNRQIAQDAWTALKRVNPDNQKIDDFKKRIHALR